MSSKGMTEVEISILLPLILKCTLQSVSFSYIKHWSISIQTLFIAMVLNSHLPQTFINLSLHVLTKTNLVNVTFAKENYLLYSICKEGIFLPFYLFFDLSLACETKYFLTIQSLIDYLLFEVIQTTKTYLPIKYVFLDYRSSC